MYAIQFFVGSKFGTWATGTERYASEAFAQRAINIQAQRERQADCTPLYRRPVEISDIQRKAA